MHTKPGKCAVHGNDVKWFCACKAPGSASLCDDCLAQHSASQHPQLREQFTFEVQHYPLFQSFCFDAEKLTQRLQCYTRVTKLLTELDSKENEMQVQANSALQELCKLFPQWLEDVHRDFQSTIAILRRETDLLLRNAVCEVSAVTNLLISAPVSPNVEQLLQFPELSMLCTLTARVKYASHSFDLQTRLRKLGSTTGETIDMLANSLSPAANSTLSKLPAIVHRDDGSNVSKSVTENEEGLYIGSWDYKDRRNGMGRQVFTDKSIFEGEWKDDKQEGWGRLVKADGGVYEGQWKDNFRHGFGTESYADGSTYSGQFTQGICEGFGTFSFGCSTQWSGDVYCGWFRNGLFHGRGAYWWADGGLFVGEWSSHKKHGRGLIYSTSGRVYYGDWLEGEPHGHGYDANIGGRQLCAEFSSGKMYTRLPSPC